MQALQENPSISLSIEAIVWALKSASGVSGREQVVLIGLGEHANADGTVAFPSQATLAGYARCSLRTVARAIESLEEKGLIERGDQRLARRYSTGHRPPIVWNLRLDRVRNHAETTSEYMSPVTEPDGNDYVRGDQTCHSRSGNLPLVVENHASRGVVTVPNRPEPQKRSAAQDSSIPAGAWTLVDNVIGQEFPSGVRTGLARKAAELLAEGKSSGDIEAGLQIWQSRPGVGPGLLPYLVGDAVKARTMPSPKSTTNDRVAQAQALKRPEWDDYDPALDRPAVGLAARFIAQKAITR
ncbi:MAG: hypothetical protein JWN03_7853 [Nocardia sp.]|uniref:helix-turn-helix domain-containing protein n=1 Tax=Nocardia sp. TaxID=1821 RepID=UPI002623AEFC|nr:helix-turn-helix domain-containing protein [Nocardia sp.]MCU1647578.1 hypothetical protein [Nocardia sp.]